MWLLTLIKSYISDDIHAANKPIKILSRSQWFVLQCGRGIRNNHQYIIEPGIRVKGLFEQAHLIKLERQLKTSTGVAYRASALLLGNGGHYITLCLQPDNTYAVVDDTYDVRTIEDCIARDYKLLFILLVRSDLCGLERPLLTVPQNESSRCLSTACAAFWSRLPYTWWASLNANLPPDTMRHVPLLTKLLRSYFAGMIEEEDTVDVQKQFLRGQTYGNTCESHPCIQDFLREVAIITPEYIQPEDRVYEVNDDVVMDDTIVPALLNVLPSALSYTDRASASA